MDYTTLPIRPDEGKILEPGAVTSLYETLRQLSDARRGQGKRYELALILCLLVLAKMAGQTSLSGATDWIRHRAAALADHFGLRRQEHAMPDDVLQRARASGCQAPGRALGSLFCAASKPSSAVERNQADCTRRKGRLITLIRLLMAKPCEPPLRSLIRCTSSVAMRWPLASSCGIAMCRRKKMRSVRSSPVDATPDQRAYLHPGCDAYPACALHTDPSVWRGLYPHCQGESTDTARGYR